MPTASSASPKFWVPHLRNGVIVAKVGIAAILLAVLPLNAQHLLTLSTGQTLTVKITSTATVLHLGRHRIPLKRDKNVASSSLPTLRLVAELPGEAILLTDTYPSRPLGLSQCQAGEEWFLRVLALKPHPTQTFHVKLASCRDNIEFADDGLQWSPDARTLTLHWLTPPAFGPSNLVLHIAPNGRVLPDP